MGKLKLTKAQADVIRKMREGERLAYFPYAGWYRPNDYYSINFTTIRKSTVDKLVKSKLITQSYSLKDGRVSTLTELGKTCELPQ